MKPPHPPHPQPPNNPNYNVTDVPIDNPIFIVTLIILGIILILIKLNNYENKF